MDLFELVDVVELLRFGPFKFGNRCRACQEKYLQPAYAGDAPPGPKL
jgi:hypothetical protein